MSYFDNIVYSKSKDFAVRIIGLNKYLVEIKHEYVMSKQVLRSGTSVGANLAESKYAQSTAGFVSKMAISRKEANETLYWLELLSETGYIEDSGYQSLKKDCEEIIKLLTSSILTLLHK